MKGNQSEEFVYIGDELTLFENANQWKNYWSSKIIKYLGSEILEVGAGLGGTTKLLLPKVPHLQKWTCLEPDDKLLSQIKDRIPTAFLDNVSFIKGTINDLPKQQLFESILYIDVIEHIEDDAKELQSAMGRLKSGGHIIILVPAHQFLFSEFDKSIGHYRRYNKTMLNKVLPKDGKKILLQYLDMVGLSASTVNKLFLHQSYPTLKQILFWDRTMVPFSKIFDPITFHRFGKSLLMVIKKD